MNICIYKTDLQSWTTGRMGCAGSIRTRKRWLCSWNLSLWCCRTACSCILYGWCYCSRNNKVGDSPVCSIYWCFYLQRTQLYNNDTEDVNFPFHFMIIMEKVFPLAYYAIMELRHRWRRCAEALTQILPATHFCKAHELKMNLKFWNFKASLITVTIIHAVKIQQHFHLYSSLKTFCSDVITQFGEML